MHSPNLQKHRDVAEGPDAAETDYGNGRACLCIAREKLAMVKVGLSIAIYLVVVSMIPVWNKKVFSSLNSGKKFHYPLTVTCLQLGACSFILGMFSVLKHFLYDKRCCRKVCRKVCCAAGATIINPEPGRGFRDMGSGHYGETKFSPLTDDLLLSDDTEDPEDQSEAVPISWVFGPGIQYKMKKILVIGLFFGLKYGISNWGLDLVSTPTHLLLNATDMFWSALFAFFIAKESVGKWGIAACIGTVAGSVLIALRTEEELTGAIFPLIINLTAPVILGICIATLRTASLATMINPEPGCGFRDMNSLEFTSIKLAFSSSIMIPFVLMFEVGNLLNRKDHVSVFDALRDAEPLLIIGIFIGSVFVAMFQANITWLTALTSAITTGLIGGVKVVPQWLFSLLFNLGSLDISTLNLVGAALVVVSVAMWGYSNYKKTVENRD